LNWYQLLDDLLEGNNLDIRTSYNLATAIAKNELSDVLKSAFLVALRCKGEKGEEVAGFAMALRDLALKVGPYPDALDTAGTGGDKSSLFNVSTATALLLAMMGYKVVKHGNRSVSSNSGSADLLESLGYKIELSPQEVERALSTSNFAFIFAPLYHPAMKNVMPVRRELRVRTIFNLVGPLSNPAKPGYQLLGVAKRWMLELIANALRTLGIKRAAVIHGRPGIDEVSPISTTDIILIDNNEITKTVLDVTDFGIQPLRGLENLKVRNIEESKMKVLKALRGEGDEAKFLALNAALALHVRDNIDVADAFRNVMDFLNSYDTLEGLRRIVESSGGTPTF